MRSGKAKDELLKRELVFLAVSGGFLLIGGAFVSVTTLFFPDFAEKVGTALNNDDSETILLKLFTLFAGFFLNSFFVFLLGIMPFFFGFSSIIALLFTKSYQKKCDYDKAYNITIRQNDINMAILLLCAALSSSLAGDSLFYRIYAFCNAILGLALLASAIIRIIRNCLKCRTKDDDISQNQDI